MICESCLLWQSPSYRSDDVFCQAEVARKHHLRVQMLRPSKCRVCGHAHGVDTRCVCSCWVDSLKAALIIPPNLDAFGHLPRVAGPSKNAMFLNIVAPAEKAEKAKVMEKAKVVEKAEDAESDELAVS